MLVITSGAPYIDIDAYACIVAYQELLTLLNKPAVGAISVIFNESITPSLRKLKTALRTDYKPDPDDQFVVMDVSEPSNFDHMVDLTRVVEMIDHHPGFEEYWSSRLGAKSQIESIGACATLVYEAWQKAGKLSEMSQASAKLLAAAILDNTLNFGAGVTTERDKQAYAFLKDHAHLDDAWAMQYFIDCQNATLQDLPNMLKNDSRYFKRDGLDEELCMVQVVVWDAKRLVTTDIPLFKDALDMADKLWLVNIIYLAEGRSYFVAPSPKVQQWLNNLIDIQFDGEVGIAKRLWLRKEIMKLSQA